MKEGLDLAIEQVKALNFLGKVGNGDISYLQKKIKEDDSNRDYVIRHLRILYVLSRKEADEVITKFLGGQNQEGKNEE